jgi:hypothetical protein
MPPIRQHVVPLERVVPDEAVGEEFAGADNNLSSEHLRCLLVRRGQLAFPCFECAMNVREKVSTFAVQDAFVIQALPGFVDGRGADAEIETRVFVCDPSPAFEDFVSEDG